jgi:hypothetical protein
MNEFLLLALITVYLAVCYAPVSSDRHSNSQSHQNEQTSQRTAELDEDGDFGSR